MADGGKVCVLCYIIVLFLLQIATESVYVHLNRTEYFIHKMEEFGM